MRSWKRYPKYKDSGVEWLGEIPDGWLLKRIKLASPITNKKIDRVNQDLQYIALENIESWTGKYKQSIGEIQPESMVNIFCENNVLFGKLRPYLAKVYQTNNDGVCSSEFFVLKPKDLTPEYLFDFLLNREFIDIINSSTYGAKMPRANWDFFGNQMISIPSLPEQTAIASFLDRETTRIDELIEKKQRQIDLLQEKRAALISQAVTKGLDPTVPMRDSKVPWLGEVPEHWDVIKLKWIAKMDSGHTPDRKIEEYWEDCNIPWVSLNDTKYLKDHDYIENTTICINEKGMQNSSAHLLPSKTVVFTRDATIGLCAITTRPMAVSQHIIAWICKPSIIPEYLLHVFYSMNQELDSLTMGSTIKTIGMSDALELVSPLPPKSDQEAIIKFLLEERERIMTITEKIAKSIKYLQEYRSALISAAVTGKIDVRKTISAHSEAQS